MAGLPVWKRTAPWPGRQSSRIWSPGLRSQPAASRCHAGPIRVSVPGMLGSARHNTSQLLPCASTSARAEGCRLLSSTALHLHTRTGLGLPLCWPGEVCGG